MPKLDVIRGQMRMHRPVLAEPPPVSGVEASVALVLHEPPGGGTELLFIERAVRA